MKRLYPTAALLLLAFFAANAQPLYYRSATDGNWNQASTWEVSNDFTNWGPASSPPDAANPNTLDITIQHTVTVSTNVTADQVFVDTTGRLRITASTYTVANSGQPFDITVGGALELTGGQIIGAGKARIQKIMDWSGGTNGVQTTVDTAAALNITGTVTLQNSITMNGTCNHTGGSIFFQNGTVNLNGSWYIDPVSVNQFGNGGGINLYAVGPNGKLHKLSDQTFTNNVPTIIDGELDVQSGLYIAQNNTTFTGILNIASPGTFRQSGNTTFNSAAGITGTGNYNLTAGTWANNTDLTFTDVTLNISGGTLNGDPDDEIFILAGEDEDDLLISGGTINGPVILQTGANAAITGGFTLQDIFTVNGTVNHTNGSIFFQDGTININGTWNENPESINQFGHTSGTNLVTINSGGVLNKSGTATFTSNIPINNAGTIAAQAGTLIFQNPSVSTGIISISPGAFVQNNNILTFNPGMSVIGSGKFTQNSGSLFVNTPVTLPSTLIFDVNSGTLDGPALFNTAGITNWNGGTISLPFTIEAGGTMNVPGGTTVVLQDVLTNNGNFNFLAQNLNFQNGTFINNNVLNINSTGTHQFNNTSGVNNFFNAAAGVINKNGTAFFTNQLPSVNEGVIHIKAGTKNLNRRLTNRFKIIIDPATTLQCNDTLKLEPGTVLEGAGKLIQNSGPLEVNTPAIFPMKFELNGFAKTIGLSTLTIRDTMIWAGSIESPITIDSLFWILTSPGTTPVLKSTLLAKGTAEVSAGSSVSFQNGTLEVDANGILKVGSDVATPASAFFNTSGVNKIFIRNNAILQKIGTQPFTSFISTDVEGDVNIDNGTFVQNGGTVDLKKLFQAGIDAQFRFGSASTLNINTGAVINGNGIFEFLGTVNMNTNFEFPAGTNVFFKSGNWVKTGNPLLTIGGSYTWEGGTSNVEKSVRAGGVFKSIGVVAKNMNNSLTVNTGGSWQLGGTNYNFGNANISIKGMVELNAIPANPVSLNNTGGSNFSFSDGAVLRGINSNGITTINIPAYLNKATMDGIGTMNFNSALSGNFKLTPAFSPGILTINSTSPLLSDSTELEIEIQDGTGPGTGHDQLQRAGNLVLDGTLNVLQTGSVPLGIYTIISLTSGTISGSFDVVNLPPGYTLGQTETTVFVSKLVLPLHLHFFSARMNGGQIEVSWQTATEENTSHFEIERSADGRSFETIGNRPAAGNSTSRQHYFFTDKQPLAGNSFYRLKIFERNGLFTYSNIAKIEFRKVNAVKVLPNPAHDFILIEGSENFEKIVLFDGNGKLVKQFAPMASRIYPVSDLQAGIYWIFLSKKEETEVVKFIRR